MYQHLFKEYQSATYCVQDKGAPVQTIDQVLNDEVLNDPVLTKCFFKMNVILHWNVTWPAEN